MAVTNYSVEAFARYTLASVSFKFTVVYLLMVALSKKWKQHVKPIQLNNLMVVYNYSMSAANGACCLMFALALLRCDRFYSKERERRIEAAALLYWLLKVAELLDTAFMMLRHKTGQITFLHVYHHASMVLLTDYFYHLAPWPAISFPVMINAFVHVCLYAYYGLTSASVSIPVAWKKRMTQLQIAQFGIGLAHAGVGYLRHGFCAYSVFYALTMIGLFGNFYLRAYVLQRKQRKEQ